MKTLAKLSLLAFLLFAGINSNAQSSNDKKAKQAKQEKAVKGKIDSNKYTFIANYVTPLAGTQRYLNTNTYDIKVSKDSVQVYLPYFGRVYMNAPVAGADGGMKFTSTKFDYKVKQKKSGWLITINFSDTDKARRLTLDVSPNGRTMVSAISYNRDPITYYGDISL